MHPVALTIPGEYWDSQIYQGRLYLFRRDGSIQTFDWDKLINSLFDGRRSLALAVECAFRRSDYLYGAYWQLFFSDPDIKGLLEAKFARLASKDLAISKARLRRCEVGQQDNPFPFPHADSTIYSKNLYVTGKSGVWRATCNKRTTHPISSKAERKWDCSTYSIGAAYHTLALAAGNEGLWECALDSRTSPFDSPDHENPRLLSDHDCDSCAWMYHSIYGSSYVGAGFLADFERDDEYGPENIARHFLRIVPAKDIFKGDGYSWGTKDKIYLLKNSRISVAQYNPYSKDNTLQIIGQHELSDFMGGLVSGGVATYGTILEYDDAIVILPSEGDPVVLKGEPVNWRVFPGSHHYQNHLHVIYDDYLAIYSFNHDYFVEQGSKIFGARARMAGRPSAAAI